MADSTTETRKPFEGFVILELMGHRRLAGHLTEQEIAGASFLRLDIPGAGDTQPATQFYAPGAVYCITPTTEAMVQQLAAIDRPAPVSRYELIPERTPRDGDNDNDFGL